MYSYPTYYSYIILKKDKNYLAILTNPNIQWELRHYYVQGFAFFMEVSAFDANSAIEIAKQNENSEIIKLKAELNSLNQKYEDLITENRNLKYNNQFRSHSHINNINPLEVLGFESQPNKSELKKRYRELSHKVHPDKEGGNNFLMGLINRAYEELNKIVV